ncbi:MAG: pyrimidine dimer DNA glycosylase [Candidatus Omnitrophica bacterium]|nr:pyrimidine dimer DNA glycosylase [Candidatus Omnitrophota bacterium]
MRIWDIAARKLCRNHLLGEHRELHAIWVVITKGRKGYSRHPETLRWKGKLKALFLRHEELVAEMKRRGYGHLSPLDKRLAVGKRMQAVLITPKREQIKRLKAKGCECRV